MSVSRFCRNLMKSSKDLNTLWYLATLAGTLDTPDTLVQILETLRSSRFSKVLKKALAFIVRKSRDSIVVGGSGSVSNMWSPSLVASVKSNLLTLPHLVRRVKGKAKEGYIHLGESVGYHDGESREKSQKRRLHATPPPWGTSAGLWMHEEIGLVYSQRWYLWEKKVYLNSSFISRKRCGQSSGYSRLESREL